MEANTRHRGVIKRDQVRVDERESAPAQARAAQAAPACTRSPSVRLVRLDEGTQAFEFTCSCGEVSLIEIQYEKNP